MQPYDCYSKVGNSMQYNGQVNPLLNDGGSTSVQYYQNSDNTATAVNIEHILHKDVSMDVQNYRCNSNIPATQVDMNSCTESTSQQIVHTEVTTLNIGETANCDTLKQINSSLINADFRKHTTQYPFTIKCL